MTSLLRLSLSRVAWVFLVACAGPSWKASALLLDMPALVADAMGEEPKRQPFNAKLVPHLSAPTSLRPCCALGMDLRISYSGIPVPWYSIANVTDLPSLGPHEYDNGTLTFQSNGKFLGLERNGVVYTCRGGFVDIAHVRDNADGAFFFGTRLLATMPAPFVLDYETMDAKVHVEVRVPPDLLATYGHFETASAIAEWLAFHQGLWHEVAQWWGYTFSAGYSEQVSAFSSEDLYSNALGARLGGLAIRQKIFRTREDYNAGIDAALAAALTLLQVVPEPSARAVLEACDGVLWKSGVTLPDNQAVPKRSFTFAGEISPWLLQDVVPSVPQPLQTMCRQPTHRPLTVRTHLGDREIASFANIEWEPTGWAKDDFYAATGKRRIPAADMPRLVKLTEEAMAKVLKEKFNVP